MKKVLFTATVFAHIKSFHKPYLIWFSKNDYEVHIACANAKKIDYVDQAFDIPISRSPYKLNNIIALLKLKNIITQNNYDIIHCHTPMGSVLTRLAASKSRKKGTKVIYTAHGFHFFKGAPIKNWVLYYPVEKILSTLTDILITINKEDYSLAKKKFYAKKIEHINGIGFETNFLEDFNKDDKLNELNLSKEDFVLLSIGELNENKNHESVIRSLKNINYSNFHYLICGKGTLHDRLENLIIKLNLEKHVTLLGYRNDISEILQISDIYIHPSFREGLPVSVMEAMAAGLPIVASKIRGNVDLIDENKGGILVCPDNISGFTNAINSILNSNKLEKFGYYNKQKIKDYSIDNVLNKVTEIYKNT
jgi:glycosyltransferase EpsD